MTGRREKGRWIGSKMERKGLDFFFCFFLSSSHRKASEGAEQRRMPPSVHETTAQNENASRFWTLISSWISSSFTVVSLPLQSLPLSPSHVLFLPPSWFVWGCCRQDDKIVLVIIFITVCTLFSPPLHSVSCNLMISPSQQVRLRFQMK